MASTQPIAQVPSGMASKAEPNRNKKYDPKKPHITEQAITSANWYKHVNWLNVYLIVGVPIYGLIQAYWTPLQWKTAVFAIAYYFMTGLGITAGTVTQFPTKLILVSNLTLYRLSQTMGTHILLRQDSSQDLPCRSWCRCCRRLHSMVVQRPSCSPQIYRHRQGPLFRSQRPPLFPLWLDDHEAEPKAYWSY
jgi:hypothetical protein